MGGQFLQVWAFMGVSLAVAVLAATVLYRVFGADLGLKGFGWELLIVAGCSFATACIYCAVSYMSFDALTPYSYIVNVFLTALIFRLAHKETSGFEAALVGGFGFVAAFALRIVVWAIEIPALRVIFG